MAEPALLAPEDLSTQLDVLQVVLSLYGDDGLELPRESAQAIEDLARFLALPLASLGDAGSVALRDKLPVAVAFGLVLDPLRGSVDASDGRTVRLDVEVPLRRRQESASLPTRPSASVSQAGWMARQDHADLVDFVRTFPYPGDGDGEAEEEGAGSSYILSLAEDLCERAVPLLLQAQSTEKEEKEEKGATEDESNKSTRSWHLLVSLSVPSKRADLVSYAVDAGLTGFVLAGKPGLVVVESPTGTAAIDAYWRDIRSRSWSDLPPASKKVTQRLVEDGAPACFAGFRDISEQLQPDAPVLGPGGHVRRTDLGALRRWLDAAGGLADRLDAVL
ncbi:hypothetical protein FA10DRAFT_285409 [Acaromyces ingoldii]|uniref:Small nuclear ribonucleoprotein Prp3 C-terminal domain-containing protein n=1 Tax=Acaromyces ingoldii TaxID=215250 RepID=A0A316YTD4_9BASI|nr:hypothetical protein FA10DRAFT_285409 [Acaromyces ingoldii]PWN92549.1 hypothetical protein FA10DRAFT_285409 [Acaromyces ingoldii]